MTDSDPSPLEQVREVLLSEDREELALLRTQVEQLAESEVGRLRARVEELTSMVERLESMMLAEQDRAETVGAVLVDAVYAPQEDPGKLGSALRPEIELAVHESARVDSVVLAEALYPVMGPAMRKMVASLFTFDLLNPGETFIVDRVLLIERESGVLLAAVHRDPEDADDADVVSGMLDAIRLFVQDAFDAVEHDGLRDLRVGDTSVLVEWGPRAVLASVVRGVPTEDYRASAAFTLEQLHVTHAGVLEDFSGDVSSFDNALDSLGQLREQGEPESRMGPLRVAATVTALGLVVIVAVLLVVWLS